MATRKRKKRRGKSSGTPGIEDLTLPSERSEPEQELGAYSILLYGEKKIGKTALCSQFPEAFFIMTEPGGKGLRIFQRHATSWLQFQRYVDLVCDSSEFETVIVDTADLAYDLCMRHVCSRLGIDDPGGQDDYGASWRAVRAEFTFWISKLLASGKGVVFTSHMAEAEVTSRLGKKYQRIQSSMGKQPREVLDGVVDIWCYFHYVGEERFLQIAGDDFVSAGNRLDERLLTPRGERVRMVPMGKSKEEAYVNFVKAWDNKQSDADGGSRKKRKTKAKSKAKAKTKKRKT